MVWIRSWPGNDALCTLLTSTLFNKDVDIDFGTFLTILTRPDGFKPAGTSQEFIQGFQVFDKEGDNHISAGELRYGL